MQKLPALFAQKKNRLRQILKSLGQSKERPNEHIDFTIDLALFEYSTTWMGLNEAFAKNPKTLKLQITFAVDCSVEFVLMVNELFARNPKVMTHVHTWCSLRDASLLLLLSGNRKTAAWYAWTRLTKLEELRAFENQEEREEDLFAPEPRSVSFGNNYAAALKVIDSYIPAAAIGGRRHNICHLLREYGLLSEEPVYPFRQNTLSFGL
jgi:hypothetical protein